eukprot:157692-Chlamydomonas_euryale.AAC.4
MQWGVRAPPWGSSCARCRHGDVSPNLRNGTHGVFKTRDIIIWNSISQHPHVSFLYVAKPPYFTLTWPRSALDDAYAWLSLHADDPSDLHHDDSKPKCFDAQNACTTGCAWPKGEGAVVRKPSRYEIPGNPRGKPLGVGAPAAVWIRRAFGCGFAPRQFGSVPACARFTINAGHFRRVLPQRRTKLSLRIRGRCALPQSIRLPAAPASGLRKEREASAAAARPKRGGADREGDAGPQPRS